MPLAHNEPPGGWLSGGIMVGIIPPGASARARRCLVVREAVSGHASRGCHTNVFFVLVCLFVLCLFNTFTAPACKISALNDAGTRLQRADFRSYNTSTFNAMRSYGNPFT